jgi:acyl-CoA hydrolase
LNAPESDVMPAWIQAEDLRLSIFVKSGDFVLWGQACGEPLVLTEHLMAQRREIGGFKAFIGISLSNTPDPDYTDCVQFLSYCGTAQNARLTAQGKLDILPMHYSRLVPTIRNQVDVILVQLAESPDGESYSLVASCDYLMDLIPQARTVIAEVNRQAPFSDAVINADDIDVWVPTDYPPASLTKLSQTQLDERIANRVAGLIEDGATVQFGLGATPECVAEHLTTHRQLGLHCGVISDAAMVLIQQGAVTNEHKPCDQGVSIAGSLLGSATLLAWSHSNPKVGLRPIHYTHNIARIAAMPKFAAINSAVEIDLLGQANTESINGRYVGTIGGAMDFARGAHGSKGGLPIIAMPSVVLKRDGTKISRIVTTLSGPATLGCADIGIVVTEHGIADLRGLSIKSRARELIDIADPDFRDTLASTAAEHV